VHLNKTLPDSEKLNKIIFIPLLGDVSEEKFISE
jgi:hypothetical protein